MKKSVKAIIGIMLAGIIFTGCGTKEKAPADNSTGQKTEAEDTSLKDIKQKGELVLGLDDALPPMGFRDNDQKIVGFDIDLANEVCKRMGIQLKLQPISWDAKDQELDTKNIDCIWNGFTWNEEREKNNTCSSPYMKNTQVAVVPAVSEINSLNDLSGKTVAIQNGSTAEDAVNGNKEFKDSLKELIMVSDNVKALMDLEVGGSDAVVMDEVVARYYMAKDPSKYKILDASLAEEKYVIGFRKGDKALCEEVNKYLKELSEEGVLTDLSRKWLKDDLTIVK